MEDNIITLWGPNGPLEFELLDLVAWQGSEYAVLLPVNDEEGIVQIIRMDDGSETFEVVRDEEAKCVFQSFRERNRDTFDFEEDTL